MLNIYRLSKSFARTEAVRNLSFAVQPGEVLGLLGPNGAGKTTTLRAVAGVIRPDEGTVLVDGRDVAKDPVGAKRLIAYLPDQPAFFHNLTCWEHIQFLASVHEVKDWENRARQLFARFELAGKEKDFPSDLSKGMRQRLALIGAFLHRPALVLFDEPMTGLDPHGIRVVNEVIREEAARGAAIVLSSHLLSYLAEVCTKVLVMDRGEAKLYGTLAEVRGKFGKGDASLEQIFLESTKKEAA